MLPYVHKNACTRRRLSIAILCMMAKTWEQRMNIPQQGSKVVMQPFSAALCSHLEVWRGRRGTLKGGELVTSCCTQQGLCHVKIIPPSPCKKTKGYTEVLVFWTFVAHISARIKIVCNFIANWKKSMNGLNSNTISSSFDNSLCLLNILCVFKAEVSESLWVTLGRVLQMTSVLVTK